MRAVSIDKIGRCQRTFHSEADSQGPRWTEKVEIGVGTAGREVIVPNTLVHGYPCGLNLVRATSAADLSYFCLGPQLSELSKKLGECFYFYRVITQFLI